MKYRAEIDGLRALAVIPVILFHAGFSLFSGGYVGVDVFFVISGYLITTIIVNEMQEERFSLANFYERRARRILPALLLVLTITYCLSWFWNLPEAHKVVGQYVVSSIVFSSNLLLYLKGNDYFGLEDGSNPLFHTWSLAVEEQYYILFPIFLMIAWRFGKRTVLTMLAVIFVASMGGAHYGAYNSPAAAFFLLQTRGWEILLGAILAFFSKPLLNIGRLANQLLSLLGLFLISYAVLAYDNLTPTPSLYTLAPTVGAGLIISSAREGTLVRKLLSSSILVGIGLISYSAYLWHLPVFTMTRQLVNREITIIETYLMLAVVFFLAYVSWRFVEVPFRKKERIAKLRFFVLIGVCASLLSCLGIAGHLNGGFVDRNPIFSKLRVNNGYGLQCNGNVSLVDMCTSTDSPTVAVLGNSFSMQFVSSLSDYYKEGVVQLTQDSCRIGYADPFEDINSMPCPKFFREAMKTINQNSRLTLVFVSSPFTEVLNDVFRSSMITLLNEMHDRTVVILGPTPAAPFSVGECLKSKYLSPFGDKTLTNCDFSVDQNHMRKVEELSKLAAGIDHVQFVDITPFICQNGKCLMEPESGLFMYVDSAHLSRDGADYVLSQLAEESLIPKPN